MTIVRNKILRCITTISVVLAVLGLIACGSDPKTTAQLAGTIEIDGSSTVAPVSIAVAEEFRKMQPKVRVNVGISGTGGGFKRFTAGETDISDASRLIRDEERAAAGNNSINFVEMKVGTDGLSVLVHPKNEFVDCLTVEELKKTWEPGSTVKTWSDVRSSFPSEKIQLFGPDTDSGTFDYFTEEIIGEVQASRADYTASADDNILVRGISGSKYALGYFGYSYYSENKESLKAIAIDDGNGCVAPEAETIEDGSYTPLSRPLFIYVNTESVKRPEVIEFIRFYMEVGAKLTREVGYVPEAPSVYTGNLTKVGL